MTLRKRTLTLARLAFAGPMASLYTTSPTILLDSFARLEEQSTQTNELRLGGFVPTKTDATRV